MPSYQAPIRDMQFVLKEVFNAEALWQQFPACEDFDDELIDAILEEAGKIAENCLFPINQTGDEQQCQWQNGHVITPDGFREAYQTFAEAGWVGLIGDPDYGGQGIPKMLAVLVEEMTFSSNASFALCPVLSSGAAICFAIYGSAAIKALYLPRLYDGSWAATMCLTEAHSGTDLGIMKTRAEPQEDGTYCITGSKIFITGGEHDLTENIVHFVLARLPDAPAGSKGISLFLIPKLIPNEDGSLGDRNAVSCGSIEHKMGIKASATCVMNFDAAKGWLIGEPHQGLACMFTMMNYARLSIALQGLGLAEVAYQNARNYARERLQGRSASGAVNPEKMADPIIVHGDVRCMLLTQKAFNEAGRALAVYVAMQLDIAKFSVDDRAKKSAQARVALLTPVVKAFFTDKGFDCCVLAQQVFGGHGYIREWGVEQYVRDARIAQIYEGTNGVQAMDLLGRKVIKDHAVGVKDFIAEIYQSIEQNEHGSYQPLKDRLQDSLQKLQRSTDYLLSESRQNPHKVGTVAVHYLQFLALVSYGYMWLKMASLAELQDDDFYQSKRATANYFFHYLLPEVESLRQIIEGDADMLMDIKSEWF